MLFLRVIEHAAFIKSDPFGPHHTPSHFTLTGDPPAVQYLFFSYFSLPIDKRNSQHQSIVQTNIMTRTDNAPQSRQSRIPATLQAVFLASNRGKEVNKPPPAQVGNKVFFRNWFLQRKPTSKRAGFGSDRSLSSETSTGRSMKNLFFGESVRRMLTNEEVPDSITSHPTGHSHQLIQQ